MYANVTLPLTLVSNKLNVPFFPRYFNGIKIVTAFKCIFEETMPKMLVNFGNHISQDSHKNQYSSPVCNFGFTVPQVFKFDAEVQCLSHWWHTQKFLCHLRDHPIHALVGLFGTSYHVLMRKHNKMTSSMSAYHPFL